jgi:Flp pilus assembly protein TadD
MKKPAAKAGTPPDRAIYLVLFLATLVVYSQVHNYAFVSFDDTGQLLGNPEVRDGLTGSGLAWAFTTGYAANWFPLNWISHMLDFQFFGVDAGWHHLTSAAIHAASSVLLLAVLKRMTGRVWESAFVAFVFALHPLHVESVAWVSERKDVLSAFFWFLTIWLYLDFVEKRSAQRYLLMAAAFCCGLMSKQMIVTLPFTLLLLDAWPLKRNEGKTPTGWKALVIEKIPLVALSIAASVIAFVVQKQGGAVRSLASIPLGLRAENALTSYGLYLANFVWPTGLAFFYPYRSSWPATEVALAGAVLAGISALALLTYRTRPYLAVGWFWYLGTLAPVIGLIQIGYQARADRYTYVPLIGISIMLAWSAKEAFEKWPRAKPAIQGAAILACSAWVLITWVQTQYWRDSETLYRRAIAVTDANYLAHLNLGADLAARGKFQEAVPELDESLAENPDQPHARTSLGAVLSTLGRTKEAIAQYSEAIRLEPQGAESHCNLGNALVDEGRMDEALRELNTAEQLKPGMPSTYYGLGRVLIAQNRLNDAAAYFSEALRINPNFTAARQELASLRATRK